MGLDPLTLKDLKCLGIARLLQRTAWIALAISVGEKQKLINRNI